MRPSWLNAFWFWASVPGRLLILALGAIFGALAGSLAYTFASGLFGPLPPSAPVRFGTLVVEQTLIVSAAAGAALIVGVVLVGSRRTAREAIDYWRATRNLLMALTASIAVAGWGTMVVVMAIYWNEPADEAFRYLDEGSWGNPYIALGWLAVIGSIGIAIWRENRPPPAEEAASDPRPDPRGWASEPPSEEEPADPRHLDPFRVAEPTPDEPPPSTLGLMLMGIGGAIGILAALGIAAIIVAQGRPWPLDLGHAVFRWYAASLLVGAVGVALVARSKGWTAGETLRELTAVDDPHTLLRGLAVALVVFLALWWAAGVLLVF